MRNFLYLVPEVAQQMVGVTISTVFAQDIASKKRLCDTRAVLRS
jgi:hypothetical protein